MNKSMLISVVICSIATLTPANSSAALLASGDTIALAGTTVAMQPELAGTVILDSSIYDSVAPSGNNVFQVGIEVTNRVVRSTLDGSLIFAPRIVPTLNNTGGNFLIDRVVTDGFTDFTLDVNYRSDGLGDRGPNNASRSVSGDQLSFDFLFPLVVSNLFENPQEQSYFFSIHANATAYANTGSMSIFGRHLNYPGETFEFNYTGLAVPIVASAQVAEPIIRTLFFICLVCLLGFKNSQQ